MLISSIASCNDAQAVHVGKIAKRTTQELKHRYGLLQQEAQCVNTKLVATQTHKDTNCLEDFIKNYDRINPPTFEEYCDEKLNGVKREIDYRAEYSNYLRKRECKNDSELQALNAAGFYNTSQLKKATFFATGSMLSKLSEQGLFNGNPWEAAQYISENSSISDLTNFTLNMRKVLGNECLIEMNHFKCLIELVSSLPEDETGKFNPDEIINASNKMIEILKEENANNAKASYEIEQERIFNKKDFTDDEKSYAHNQYLKQVAN